MVTTFITQDIMKEIISKQKWTKVAFQCAEQDVILTKIYTTHLLLILCPTNLQTSGRKIGNSEAIRAYKLL